MSPVKMSPVKKLTFWSKETSWNSLADMYLHDTLYYVGANG